MQFWYIIQKVSICYHQKLQTYWTKFTKFSHDVAGSLPLLMHASALRHSNLLWNASTKNEGVISQVYLFALKINWLSSNIPWMTTKQMSDLSSPLTDLLILEIWSRSVQYFLRYLAEKANFAYRYECYNLFRHNLQGHWTECHQIYTNIQKSLACNFLKSEL